MSKSTYFNCWQEYHQFLPKEERNIRQNETCVALACSANTFWRKMKNPEALSPAEKTAIAAVYQLPLHFIFPETKTTSNA